MLSPAPPAEVQEAPQPAPDPTAQVLEAFDWGRPLPPMPDLKGAAALRDRWLRLALTWDPGTLPGNPFPAGADHAEVQRLRALLKAPLAHLAVSLKAQSLQQPGTALALWRWGQRQVRRGTFTPDLRKAWEEKLRSGGPSLTQGYALRHALCWALADQDEARFATLKTGAPGDAAGILAAFQRLFGSLGGPSPVIRLWSLPDLAYQDLRLDQLGTRRLWIRPADPGPLPTFSADLTWIVPSETVAMEARGANLDAEAQNEGEALATRVRATGRRAFYLPIREDLERIGLSWFPILIDLDGAGNLKSIRMGDAAPEHP